MYNARTCDSHWIDANESTRTKNMVKNTDKISNITGDDLLVSRTVLCMCFSVRIIRTNIAKGHTKHARHRWCDQMWAVTTYVCSIDRVSIVSVFGAWWTCLHEYQRTRAGASGLCEQILRNNMVFLHETDVLFALYYPLHNITLWTIMW